MILDDTLTVQAISQRAEQVLGIKEPDGVPARLDAFLQQPLDGSAHNVDLALLARLAVDRVPRKAPVELRAADRQRRFGARLTSCGPPPAALLVLVPGREMSSSPSRDETVASA